MHPPPPHSPKKTPNPLFFHLLCPVAPKPLLASWFRSTFSSEKSIGAIKFDGAMPIIALEWKNLRINKCLVVLQRKHNCYWIIHFSFLISTSVFPSCSLAFFWVILLFYFGLDLTLRNITLLCSVHDWDGLTIGVTWCHCQCRLFVPVQPWLKFRCSTPPLRALYLKPNCVWIPLSLLWQFQFVFPIYSPVVSSQHCIYTLQIGIQTRRDLTTNG